MIREYLGKDGSNNTGVVEESRRESASVSTQFGGLLRGSYLTYNSSQPILQCYWVARASIFDNDSQLCYRKIVQTIA